MRSKPKVGFYLLAPASFRNIGEGTPGGTYHQRKTAEVEAMLRGAADSMEVCFPGIIYQVEDARRAIRLFQQEEVDCALVMYLSWANDFALNRFLRDMPPLPVLYGWLLRDHVDLGDTHDEDAFTEYLGCGSLVGSLEGSGDLARYRRPMLEIACGTWEEILARLRRFANAAMARARLKESKVGLLASYNEIMWSTYVDPYAVFMQVGPELTFLSVAELCDEIAAIPAGEVEAVTERLRAQYPLRPEVEEEKLLASVRASMAMERLAQRRNVDLIALNDVDHVLFEKVGLRPGFYPTAEDARVVIVPEGDVGGGLIAYMLKLLTGGHIHFIEPFHVDLPSDTFEGGHAGPNDYTAPGGQTQIAPDVRFAKTGYRYAGAPFAWHVFPQGLYTMAHLSQRDGGFVLAVTLVESLPEQPHLATYSHGRFRPVGQSCRELFEKLLHIGVTQHYALAAGDVTDAVLSLGRMLGFACHHL